MEEMESHIAASFGASRSRDRAGEYSIGLEELYDEYAGSLFRYAFVLTHRADDAEDAVQDAFTRLMQEQPSTLEQGATKTYLFTAVRYAAYDILRTRQRKDQLQSAIYTDAESRCGEDTEALAVEELILGEAFAELPVERREVIVLKVLEGMTLREIADMLGARPGTVASRYALGLAKLKRSLKETYG
ncbi:MAG: sigma-70 family RNA polymerase sigma factor [Armatimonadetes bacterium]|nr:sigma-70 family RNA polymerase sigma factor [Armatimonadota bacterium]